MCASEIKCHSAHEVLSNGVVVVTCDACGSQTRARVCIKLHQISIELDRVYLHFFLQLQARINSSLLSKPGLLSSIGKVTTGKAAPPPMPSKPMPLILDEEGRTVDSSGRTVQLSVKHSTAQVLQVHNSWGFL